SAAIARDLHAPGIIAPAGDDRPGGPRAGQHAALGGGLGPAAEGLSGTGCVLSREPADGRGAPPGLFLAPDTQGPARRREGRGAGRVLEEIWRWGRMGEGREDVVAGRVDRVVHAHLADTQGRGEPGSGDMDWRQRVDWLEANGYRGFIGLEYRPTTGTRESLS